MSPMLKLIYRSVLKELFNTFFLTLAFLNSVMMMEKLLRLSRLLSGTGAKVSDLAEIILYLQPQLLMLTLPMSLLLTILLVYGRLNVDSELIIMKASGMNFSKITMPAFFLGLFCFLFSLLVSFRLGPASSEMLRGELTRIIAQGAASAIEEGTFNTSFKDLVIIVKGKKSADTLEDIFIYDNRSKDEPRVLMAKEGKLTMMDLSSVGMDLRDGYMNITKDRNITELFFDRYKMSLSLFSESPSPKKVEFTPMQLLQKAKEVHGKKERAAFYVEFHRRFSLPAVCVLLIFLGTPLSLISGKSGRLGGLAIGLLVFTGYYMMLIYGENNVMAGKIFHAAGCWAPVGLLAVLAAVLFKRESAR